MVAEADASLIAEIQEKYVPFLKKLISFLEKTNKATPENLSRLKNIHTVFTTAPAVEQIEVFQANRKKLEKWLTSSQKEKMKEEGTSQEKRSISAVDTDSSQGASEDASSKKVKTSETAESTTFNPVLVSQIKQEKIETSQGKKETPKIIQPSQPVIISNVIPIVQVSAPVQPLVTTAAISQPATPDTEDKVIYTCASCQYQTYNEQEFMKHTRTDHRSDLSMWCKNCGKCFSNAGVLVVHIRERACIMEEMIYRCGVKDCPFETNIGQTFVHHLRHCHKGSPFIFCIHCQKIFTLPHCLILHMQDDCPHKDKNRRNPGTTPSTPFVNNAPAVAKPPNPPLAVAVQSQSFTFGPPTISAVASTAPKTVISSVVRSSPSLIRGRGALMPTARGRSRGRGRGRGRPPSESSDSDDPDDPSWKPEDTPGQQTLRRSGRWAKKINDVINVEPKQTNKRLSFVELNSKEMLHCPCCDFMAAFKSVLQDHYIAHHKVPNKNSCLVCNLKFEATQGFLDHFEDHASGKLTNKITPESAMTVSQNASSKTGESSDGITEKSHTEVTSSIDQNLIRGGDINSITQQPSYDKSLESIGFKKFKELKALDDLVVMLNPDKLKCFFKCSLYNCTYTTNDSNEYQLHLNKEHNGKILHCAFCLMEFSNGDSLTQHLMTKHGKCQYQCSKCFYRACSEAYVQTHIKKDHSNDINTSVFTCDPVKASDSIQNNNESDYSLSRHIDIEENKDADPTKVPCSVKLPNLSYSESSDNSYKVFSGSSDNVKRFRCGFCIKKLKSLRELEIHVENLHPVREEGKYFYYYFPDPETTYSADDKEVFECSYCKASSGNLHVLKNHSDLIHSDSTFRVRGYVIRNQMPSTIVCGYCNQSMESNIELEHHTTSQHPSLPLKPIDGSKNALFAKPIKTENLSNKKINLGPTAFICSHCGAAFSTKQQIIAHSQKIHSRLQIEFTTIDTVSADIFFYRCEFCQFIAQKQHVDLHLETKHKMRVTCGYCNKRYEFATKLRQHHDKTHKDLPIKYSQEVVSNNIIIKQEVGATNNLVCKNPENPDSADLKNIYTYSSILDGTFSRISVYAFSKECNIFPQVVLKRCDGN